MAVNLVRSVAVARRVLREAGSGGRGMRPLGLAVPRSLSRPFFFSTSANTPTATAAAASPPLSSPSILACATPLSPAAMDQHNDGRSPVSKRAHPGTSQLSFPCVEKQLARSNDGGPEPVYQRIVSGYNLFAFRQPFHFVHGGVLEHGFNIAYETWGTLNERKSNAILLHTGLSASSHAKSHENNRNPGWWEKFIGPGRALDTDKFFIICTNVIGGCYGSTGPYAVNPATEKPYATTFPILTVFDMVRAQFLLLDSLGISKLHASVGSSLGGMQSLAAAAVYPDRVSRLISISAAARSHPYSIAMRYTQRKALMSDPNWNNGYYYGGIFPHIGMKLAREIATISYRSGPEWEERFGRKRATNGSPGLCPDFLIETYLDHQGERFCLQYDPNSLLYISKAMDLFDLSWAPYAPQGSGELLTTSSSPLSPSSSSSLSSSSERGQNFVTFNELPQPASPEEEMAALEVAAARIKCPTLVLGVQSDILFPIWQQKEIATLLRKTGNQSVTYYELDAIYGHDTFLVDLVNVGAAVKGLLENSVDDDPEANRFKD